MRLLPSLLVSLLFVPSALAEEPAEPPAEPGPAEPPAEPGPAEPGPAEPGPVETAPPVKKMSDNANSKPPKEKVPASSLPINTRYESDFTAYTVPKGHVKIGLVNLDWGAMKNVHLGVAPSAFLIGYYNAHAKVTAIQTELFDLSVFGGVGYLNRTIGDVPIAALAIPVDLTGSIIASDNISFHGGFRVENAEISSQFNLETLAGGLAALLEVDLTDDLTASLSDAGALYGGAHITAIRPHLAADYRFNGRHSLIYQWRATTWLRARLDAGYTTENEELSVGVAARIQPSLKDEAIGAHTVSWQRSGAHWHLRLGLGWSTSATKVPGSVLVQACELYYLW